MAGRATTDLVRAVLISAIDEEPSRHHGWEQSLTTLVKSYIGQHLADPNLSADRIARAAFISVRQLYKLWETEPRTAQPNPGLADPGPADPCTNSRRSRRHSNSGNAKLRAISPTK